MIALAMLFSYIETFVPIPIPFVKLGLSNIVTLLLLFLEGPLVAFAVGLLRVILSSVLFGNLYSFAFSISGFLFSFLITLLMYKLKKFSIIGMSITSGGVHNLTQILMAALILNNKALLSWTFVLCVIGIICGFITGIVAKPLYERIKKNDW